MDAQQRKIKFSVKLEKELSEMPTYVWIADKLEVMALRQGGKVKIYTSICPHMGAQMTYDGSKQALECPWHGIRFDCRNQLKGDHPRYPQMHEYDGEVKNGELVIYE